MQACGGMNNILENVVPASPGNLQFFVIVRDDRPSLIFWVVLVPKYSGYRIPGNGM